MEQPLISLCMIVGNVEEYIERCLKSFLPIADEICLVRAIGNQVPDKTIEIAEGMFRQNEQNLQNCGEAISPSGHCVNSVNSVQKTFRWAEYKNQQSNDPDWQQWKREGVTSQSWPHLDDFAAARNQSFSMATGKYIFWADTDDVFGNYGEDNTQMAELVRTHARDGKYEVFLFPYRIFGRGVMVDRERMVTKKAFLRKAGNPEKEIPGVPREDSLASFPFWHFPVHECMNLPDTTAAAKDEWVVVTHMPKSEKQGSNSRNLTILESIPDDDLTPGLLYHLHGEYLGMKMHDKAIECAKRAMAMPEIGNPEKYEMFLNLGKMCEQPRTAQAMYHQAYAVDPCRREALGLLTISSIDDGKPVNSLGYARAMMALPRPKTQSWNDRPAAYQYLGIDLYTQALRVNGLNQEAEEWRLRSLSDASKDAPIISLIHATRGRPKQASFARKLWMDLADRPDAIEHIFVFDADDQASQILQRMHSGMVPPGGGCVHAWNCGAAQAKGQILIQMSDDWMPPLQWDKLIVQKFVEDYVKGRDGTPLPSAAPAGVVALPDDISSALAQPRVLQVSDGHRTDDLLCMAIMTRNYYRQDFFMFHPWFTGVYSDNYFSHMAFRRNQVINGKDLVFTHNHPFFSQSKYRDNPQGESLRKAGKHEKEIPGVPREDSLATAPMDETYRLQNAPERYAEGLKTYNELLNHNDWSTVPGYFNFYEFYRTVAKAVQDGAYIAEVGVWMGRSIICLAQELKRLGKTKVKILAIDNFKGESNQTEHADTIALLEKRNSDLKTEFLRNIARCGVADMITLLPGESAARAADVPDNHISFLFIDAAHDYDSVKADLAAWLPKVKPGHPIAGHDAQHEPVMKAVKEVLGKDVTVNASIWMAKKN